TWAHGLAFGPDGHLYVASSNSSSILRYDGRTGDFVDAFVPAGSGGLGFPVGLAFGPDGNLYVASFSNSRILRYDGTTGAFQGMLTNLAALGLSGPLGLRILKTCDCNDNGVTDGCDIESGKSMDVNGNGLPDECERIGDVTGDVRVNVDDLTAVILAWGACPPNCTFDVNDDGAINVEDLLLVIFNWTG
ncbi:MAG: hypothetical protein ACYTGC_13705, partial [Planctomycetota bacterium]